MKNDTSLDPQNDTTQKLEELLERAADHDSYVPLNGVATALRRVLAETFEEGVRAAAAAACEDSPDMGQRTSLAWPVRTIEQSAKVEGWWAGHKATKKDLLSLSGAWYSEGKDEKAGIIRDAARQLRRAALRSSPTEEPTTDELQEACKALRIGSWEEWSGRAPEDQGDD